MSNNAHELSFTIIMLMVFVVIPFTVAGVAIYNQPEKIYVKSPSECSCRCK